MRYVAEGFRPEHWVLAVVSLNLAGVAVWAGVALWRDFTSTDDIDELVRAEESWPPRVSYATLDEYPTDR